jgi:hypothetical protein
MGDELLMSAHHPKLATVESLPFEPTILSALTLFWVYSATAGTSAVVLGEAVAATTSSLLPVGPTKLITIALLIIGAGIIQEHVIVHAAQYLPARMNRT